MNHPQEDLESLRRRVALSTQFAWLIVSSVTATLYREKGEQALNDVWCTLMSAEQTVRFRDALVKLGIENDPPAIAAAKYHYFSNSIGGLAMQYVEESPRKAWIRYMPPWGSFPGIAAMAVPLSTRRTSLSTWHPRNGELLGCPRLRWVATKFVSEGHPYEEGFRGGRPRPTGRPAHGDQGRCAEPGVRSREGAEARFAEVARGARAEGPPQLCR